MIDIKPPEEEKNETPKRDITTELHEISKALKEILREMRKRKV